MILNGHQFEDKFSRELSRYLKLRNERYNLEAVKKKERKKKKKNVFFFLFTLLKCYPKKIP